MVQLCTLTLKETVFVSIRQHNDCSASASVKSSSHQRNSVTFFKSSGSYSENPSWPSPQEAYMIFCGHGLFNYLAVSCSFVFAVLFHKRLEAVGLTIHQAGRMNTIPMHDMTNGSQPFCGFTWFCPQYFSALNLSVCKLKILRSCPFAILSSVWLFAAADRSKNFTTLVRLILAQYLRLLLMKMLRNWHCPDYLVSPSI